MRLGILLSSYIHANATHKLGRPVANRNILTRLAMCGDVYITAFYQDVKEIQAFERTFSSVVKMHMTYKPLTDLVKEMAELDVFLVGDMFTHFARLAAIAPPNLRVVTFTHSLDCCPTSIANVFQSLDRIGPSVDRHVIFCTSKGAKAYLTEQSSEMTNKPTLDIIGLPIDPHILYDGATELFASQKVQSSKECLNILYLGRVDFETKLDFGDSIEQLLAMNNVSVTIAGNASAEANRYLERFRGRPNFHQDFKVEDNVRKEELLRRAHVLFSPVNSYQETFGLSLTESLAFCCYPIVSNVQGYRDQLEGMFDNLKTLEVVTSEPAIPWEVQSFYSEQIRNRTRAAANKVNFDNLAVMVEDARRFWNHKEVGEIVDTFIPTIRTQYFWDMEFLNLLDRNKPKTEHNDPDISKRIDWFNIGKRMPAFH